MAGITSVCMTGLFWETLSAHRGQEHYGHLRRSMDDLIVHKARNSIGAVNARDKYFSVSSLKGTWHCALSRNPDVVLFYSITGTTLNMAMLGTHHDYPSDGKNFSAAGRTASRIAHAVAAGHRASPGWKSVRWKRPSDLIENRDLTEASSQALDAIIEDLREEADTAPAYRRLMGRDLMSGSYEELEAWMDEVDAAARHVTAARYAKPLSCEEIVERLVARSREPAFGR